MPDQHPTPQHTPDGFETLLRQRLHQLADHAPTTAHSLDEIRVRHARPEGPAPPPRGEAAGRGRTRGARVPHRRAGGAQRSVTNIARPGWLKPYAVS